MGLFSRFSRIIQGKLANPSWDSSPVEIDDPVNQNAPVREDQHWAFKVLEVSEEASKGDIRKAYLRLSKSYHPDNFTGQNEKTRMANELMTKINKAYKLLTP